MARGKTLISVRDCPRIGSGPGTVDRCGRFFAKQENIDRMFVQTACSIILAGKGWFRSHTGETRTIQAPMAFCCPAGQRAAYGPIGTWDEVFIVFRANPISFTQRLGVPSSPNMPWPLAETDRIRRLAELMIEAALDTPAPGAADCVDRLADALYVATLIPIGNEASDRRLRLAAAFLQQNFAQSVRISQAAQVAGLSEAQFRRRFFARYGRSPQTWLNARRIDIACQMLIETDLPVSQIAAAVGLTDPRWFGQVFKAHTDHTPIAWRRRG